MVITLARRPLSLRELAVLAGLRPKIEPRTIVKKCGSFLTTEKDTVYLIHQTAKEWLENALVLDDNHNSRLQTGGTIQGHADISRRSIDAISKLQNNIYSLHPGSKLGDITIPSPDPLEGLQYSCVYWVQHLQKSNAKLSDYNQVYQFLQKHFLHWLEALGWIGKISEGIQAILSLKAHVPVSYLSIVYKSLTCP